MGSYNYYKMFGCFNRRFKITEPEPPSDVKDAFLMYTDRGSHMKADQLLRFLVEYQGERGCTLDDAEVIMHEVYQKRHHLTKHSRRGQFGIDDFFFFLFSDDLNPPIRNQVHHDMTAPLHHYFIYTGHNSYLTGNQLSSDCSEIPIINALERGVRGIELDLWPNSAKDKVHVLHGRTLTTPVTLDKCFKSIKDHAFSKSPYPVIITLEDHLTTFLQARVAELATTIFGDMLYYPESGSLEEFPSPEQLKHKIILSTKPPKEYLEEIYHRGGKEGDSDESDDNADTSDIADTSDNIYDDDYDIKKSGQIPAPQYKRIIAINAGKAKHGVRHALTSETRKVSRLSLSEQELVKAAAAHGTDIVRFTQRNILRIYPKGTRVDSSNFEPLTGWIYGAQMIAFNMQGYGRSLQLMNGMFKANGGCGYVKKPDFLMKKGPDNWVFDPTVAWPVRKTLKLNVYLGDGWRLDFSHTHFDTFSPPDFYTKVYIFGVPADNTRKKTKIIEDDWGPHWDQEFTFPLTVPELAILRIIVREHDMSNEDDFGGQTCLPVSELKTGIRAVPLYDEKGQKYKSVRLLMRFQFE